MQVKNRESAARSRQRKQAYTSELEEKVEQLQQQNADLLQKVGHLVSSWPCWVVWRDDLQQQHADQLQVMNGAASGLVQQINTGVQQRNADLLR